MDTTEIGPVGERMNLRQLRSRVRLARAYLAPGRDFELAPREVIDQMFRPPHIRQGQSYVESVAYEDGYAIVTFKGIKERLYWSRELPLIDLYRVAAECFDPTDWHYYEIPETQVRWGDTVLDCGAAEGIFALSVLERAGRIALFEPSRTFAQSLGATFADCPQVKVVPKGVGAEETEVRFSERSIYGQFRQDGEGVLTPITTIDAWAAENGGRVDYIKADVEGFEFDLVRGAAETIRRDCPTMALAVYHKQNNWRTMLEFVRALEPGYRHRVKGLSYKDGIRPVMLHLWIEARG